MENTTIAGTYQLVKVIKTGGFSEIWKAFDVKNDREVAIKIEKVNTQHQMLYAECKIYLWLQADKNFDKQHFPKVYYFGVHEKRNILAMDLLGPSLHDLWIGGGKTFSLKTTLMVAEQVLRRIEFIHSKRLIHRDIKPQNFTMGLRKNTHFLYLIDFGHCKKYLSSKNDHISLRNGRMMTGSVRFSSRNTHMGLEQSRRDDLESIGYMLVFLCQGNLPWSGFKAKNIKEKYQKIEARKLTATLEDICGDLPAAFADYLRYTRELDFAETPDYKYLRSLFKTEFEQQSFEYNFEYDWVEKYKNDVLQQMEDEKNGTINDT